MAPRCAPKPSALSTESRAQDAGTWPPFSPRLAPGTRKVRNSRACRQIFKSKGPGSPGTRLQDPQGRKPSRLSTKSRVQVAPRRAPGSSKLRNPRPCRQNQGPGQPNESAIPRAPARDPAGSMMPGSPAPRPQGSNVRGASHHLSTKSRVHAALASRTPKVGNPRTCPPNQGSK